MGRNDNTWSDRHRSAVGYAQCELGMSSSEAVKAGERGELGLPSFKMAAPTARQCAQDYRAGNIAPPDVRTSAETTQRRIQAWVDKRLGEVLAQDHPKHWELKQLAEVAAANLSITGRARPKPPKTPPTEPQDQRALLASLLQQTEDPTQTADENGQTGSGVGMEQG